MKQVLTDNIVNGIIKYIKYKYNPIKIDQSDVEVDGIKEYKIGIYFDSVPDKYIHNGYTYPNMNVKVHKEKIITREIREFVEDYFGFKSTGFQQSNNYFPPFEKHPLTIFVVSKV